MGVATQANNKNRTVEDRRMLFKTNPNLSILYKKYNKLVIKKNNIHKYKYSFLDLSAVTSSEDLPHRVGV